MIGILENECRIMTDKGEIAQSLPPRPTGIIVPLATLALRVTELNGGRVVGEPRYTRHSICGQKRSQTEQIKEYGIKKHCLFKIYENQLDP